MSSQGKPKPKPFLKRGTRQFLSNATVRSLNQKPRIVQFQDEEANNEFIPPQMPKKNDKHDFKIEIKTNIKSKIIKQQESKPFQAQSVKAKENKNMNEGKSLSNTNSISKKKAVIDDYIGIPSVIKKQTFRNSSSKEKTTNQYTPKLQTMATLLKRQDEQPESDQELQTNVKVNIPKKTNNIPKPAVLVESKEKSKHYMPANAYLEQQSHSEQVNFKSDSQEEQPKPKISFKSNAKTQKTVYKPAMKSKWDDEEQETERQPKEQEQKSSKILQKYYKKQPEGNSSQKHIQQTKEKKLSTADIPVQLKTQIFQEMLAIHQSNLQQKLNELQTTINKYEKDKQQLKEEKKKLLKEKEQFEKQRQKSTKEFQEKMATQTSKLTREKKYMKGQQMQGKGDWKSKYESEELKQKLQVCQTEKKKIKADLTRQIDRLKKKVDESVQENESLKGQIKCIQMQKIQIKEKIRYQKKGQIVKNISYWQDAPRASYTQRFFDDKFSLIDLDPQFFTIERIEHYKYYLLKKDEEAELVHEQNDPSQDKIIRRYKNGKEEVQYINKVLKEIFPKPFDFTIMHYINKDIKIKMPNKMEVYYDSKNKKTQFSMTPQKQILYFHRERQIELKFKTARGGTIHEIYHQNGELVRNSNGDQVRLKREGKVVMNRI